MSDRNCPECIWHNGRHCTSFDCEYMSYSDAKKRLQSAQPERKKGRWIKISPANIYECSECGKNVMTDDISAYDFCHGCGAEMREVTK